MARSRRVGRSAWLFREMSREGHGEKRQGFARRGGGLCGIGTDGEDTGVALYERVEPGGRAEKLVGAITATKRQGR